MMFHVNLSFIVLVLKVLIFFGYIADSLVEVNADLSVAKAVEKVKETQKADDTKKDLDMYRDASQEFVFTKTVSYTDVTII